MMTCAEIEAALLDYVEGELAPEREQAVRSHVDECSACAARYREMRRLVGDLGAARSLAVILAGVKSAREGRVVDVDEIMDSPDA